MVKIFYIRNQKFYFHIEKNDPNQQIFNWRKLLYKDMRKLAWFDKTDMVTYSLVNKDNQFVGGMIIFENPPKEFTKNISVDSIIQFFHVQKDYRGFRFGSLLLKTAIKKYKKVFLTTDKITSEVAKKMYKKYGFKIIEENKNFIYWVKL